MEYFLIVNPTAGSNNGQKLWPKIRNFLTNHHTAFRVFFTEYDGHAVALTMRILGQITETNHPDAAIIAVGGDGTLHETLLGCMRFYDENSNNQSRVPIGLLPIGSGNDFARGAHIPLRWETALETILTSHSATNLHIGRFISHDSDSDGYFLNNFGIGLDAAVVHLANHSLLKRIKGLNRLSYLASVIQALRTVRGFPLTLTHQNGAVENFPRAFLVTTTNHPYFGGGINIAPNASVLSDHLDLVIVDKPNKRQIFLFTFMLILKRHLVLNFVHHYSETNFSLKTTSMLYGQIDGEELGVKSYMVTYQTQTYPFLVGRS